MRALEERNEQRRMKIRRENINRDKTNIHNFYISQIWCSRWLTHLPALSRPSVSKKLSIRHAIFTLACLYILCYGVYTNTECSFSYCSKSRDVSTDVVGRGSVGVRYLKISRRPQKRLGSGKGN